MVGFGPQWTFMSRQPKYHHIDEDSSAIARGWTVAGVQRAIVTVGKGILVKEGDGSATYFMYNTGRRGLCGPGRRLQHHEGERRNLDSGLSRLHNGNVRQHRADDLDCRSVRQHDVGDLRRSNRIWKLTDPAGKVITLNYGANGLTSIVDPGSRTTTIDVAAGTRVLNSIQDPDNLKTQFGYDGAQRLQTVTDRRGKAHTFVYDAQSGRVVADSAPSIPVYGVGNQRPATTFDPWQKKGVPYTATSTGASWLHPRTRYDSGSASSSEAGSVRRLSSSRRRPRV